MLCRIADGGRQTREIVRIHRHKDESGVGDGERKCRCIEAYGIVTLVNAGGVAVQENQAHEVFAAGRDKTCCGVGQSQTNHAATTTQKAPIHRCNLVANASTRRAPMHGAEGCCRQHECRNDATCTPKPITSGGGHEGGDGAEGRNGGDFAQTAQAFQYGGFSSAEGGEKDHRCHQYEVERVAAVAPKQARPKRSGKGGDGEAQQCGEKHPRAHQFHIVTNGGRIACAFEAGDVWDGTEGQSHVGARGDEIGGASEVVDLPHASRFEQQSRDFVAHHRHKGVESLHTAEEAGVLQDTSHRSVGGFGARRHVGRERGGEEGEKQTSSRRRAMGVRRTAVRKKCREKGDSIGET